MARVLYVEKLTFFSPHGVAGRSDGKGAAITIRGPRVTLRVYRPDLMLESRSIFTEALSVAVLTACLVPLRFICCAANIFK